MLAIELHIQWIKRVATGTDCYSDRICVLRNVVGIRRGLVLGFIQFEADLREIVEFRNCRACNLRLYAAFQDAVQQSVDVRFFGKVEERLRFVGGLHFFEILDNFLRLG